MSPVRRARTLWIQRLWILNINQGTGQKVPPGGEGSQEEFNIKGPNWVSHFWLRIVADRQAYDYVWSETLCWTDNADWYDAQIGRYLV